MKVFVYDPFVSKEMIEKHGGIKVDNLEEASKTLILISIFFSFAISAQRREAKIPLAPPPIIAIFFCLNSFNEI